MKKFTLVDFATALKATKVIPANAVDGNIVGVDSVSGASYFQDFPSVGTVYVTQSGQHKVIIDAIAYPAHVGDGGTQFQAEIRFVTVDFDPDTLVLGPNRNNIGYDAMLKHTQKGRVLSIDVWTYTEKRMKAIDKARKDAEAAAARVRAAQLAKAKADQEAALLKREQEVRMIKANTVRTAINNF
jgi:hypothetical protein